MISAEPNNNYSNLNIYNIKHVQATVVKPQIDLNSVRNLNPANDSKVSCNGQLGQICILECIKFKN